MWKTAFKKFEIFLKAVFHKFYLVRSLITLTHTFLQVSNFKQRYFPSIASENPTKARFKSHVTFSCYLHNYSKVPFFKKRKKKTLFEEFNSNYCSRKIWKNYNFAFPFCRKEPLKINYSITTLTWSLKYTLDIHTIFDK